MEGNDAYPRKPIESLCGQSLLRSDREFGCPTRAAEVRKNLLKSAAEIAGAAAPEETLLIGQWLDSRPSQAESHDPYHASTAGRDSDFG